MWRTFRFVPSFCFSARFLLTVDGLIDQTAERKMDKCVDKVSIRIEPAAKGEDSGRTCVSFVDVISMNSTE
jgi:hypothetical protein